MYDILIYNILTYKERDNGDGYHDQVQQKCSWWLESTEGFNRWEKTEGAQHKYYNYQRMLSFLLFLDNFCFQKYVETGNHKIPWKK